MKDLQLLQEDMDIYVEIKTSFLKKNLVKSRKKYSRSNLFIGTGSFSIKSHTLPGTGAEEGIS